MGTQMFRKAVFLLSLIVPSCMLMASTTGAMLMGTGAVQVNGEETARSSTVFSGDRIQTALNASAVVKSPRALVSIGSDSTVKYEDASVTLEHGVVALTAAKGIEAHLGNLVISADPDHNAKFQLLSANGVERVWVMEGSLNVTDGTHIAKLTAGEVITHAPSSKHEDDDTVPVHKRSIPGWVKEIIIEGAIAGGIVGGLAAVGEFNSTPVSPSHP
ncbi:MAG TPA: hypothetical protein VG759_26520 [Candidatus Angelobacter sp.]|nr:hypothetical protein [Candidatus Angelobacter sp.]